MKYKLTTETKALGGITLYRIEALKDFGNVKKGEKGGFIQKVENLSQDGNAWVYGDARVYGDAEVSGNARVGGNARVYGDAEVSGNARVYGDVEVSGNARVYGDAWVYGKLKLSLGYFFGIRYKKEEIKYVKVDDDYELICKGDIKVEGEDQETIEIGGIKYSKNEVEEALKGIKAVELT